MTSDALQSTLSDLAHLLILPSRLSLKSDVELGVGGYGEVCLATLDALSASPTTVAVKQLRIIQGQGVRLRVAIRLARELKIWAKMKHRNILELLGYYLSENYGCAQLISPFMVNGNVIQYIKNKQPDISIRLNFVRDISLGMDYLHNCDPPICHGDLKPANVLISGELDAVLCDFGLASFIQESGVSSGLTTSRTTKGSMRYMSPELILDEEAMHSLKSDVWAWGCTTFEILIDCIPYSACKKESAVTLAMFQKTAPGEVIDFLTLASDPDHNPNADHRLMLKSLQSTVLECWNFEPNERPSSSSILRVFANQDASDSSSAFPTCSVGGVAVSGSRICDPNTDPFQEHSYPPQLGNHRCSKCRLRFISMESLGHHQTIHEGPQGKVSRPFPFPDAWDLLEDLADTLDGDETVSRNQVDADPLPYQASETGPVGPLGPPWYEVQTTLISGSRSLYPGTPLMEEAAGLQDGNLAQPFSLPPLAVAISTQLARYHLEAEEIMQWESSFPDPVLPAVAAVQLPVYDHRASLLPAPSTSASTFLENASRLTRPAVAAVQLPDNRAGLLLAPSPTTSALLENAGAGVIEGQGHVRPATSSSSLRAPPLRQDRALGPHPHRRNTPSPGITAAIDPTQWHVPGEIPSETIPESSGTPSGFPFSNMCP